MKIHVSAGTRIDSARGKTGREIYHMTLSQQMGGDKDPKSGESHSMQEKSLRCKEK